MERLIKAMHLNVESSRKNAIGERLPTGFRNPDLLRHTEELISSASTVLGSKSTASGGSEMRFPHSSENGQPLDRRQRQAIEDWIPHLASMEEQPPQTSDHHDKSATSDALTGTDFNLEEVQSTDSDSDDDYDIARRCFQRAKKNFSSDEHAKALESFRAGFKRVEKVGLKKKALLELRTIRLMMGLSLLSLGELSESEQCLLSLAWPQTTDDKSKMLALHASAGLAQLYLCRQSFEKAEDWCKKSRIGWRRIAGKEHPAYVTCLRLSAFSSELNGNHAEAAAFEEIANESKAAPAPVDTGLDAAELLGFTIEKSRTLITEYHKKVPDTTRQEASTKNSRLSPDKQPGSDPINDPPSQLKENSIKPKSETTPGVSLHDAARRGNTILIKKLLENGADIEEAAGEDLNRPLHLAALHENTSAVKCLLDLGANIEAVNQSSYTALSVAAWKGHKPTVECLLDHGANIEANKCKENTPLLRAAWKGHKPTVECLLDRGANIEAKNYKEKTPLIRAAWKGHTSTVECLLDRGANIEAKNYKGSTALSRAACHGHKSTVGCLLDRGAIIDATNSTGETALLLACRLINEEDNKSEVVRTIELLCSKGADVSVKDHKGRSPLTNARKVENSKIREELVRLLEVNGAKE